MNSENDHRDPISVDEAFQMKYTKNIITEIFRFSKLEVNKKKKKNPSARQLRKVYREPLSVYCAVLK